MTSKLVVRAVTRLNVARDRKCSAIQCSDLLAHFTIDIFITTQSWWKAGIVVSVMGALQVFNTCNGNTSLGSYKNFIIIAMYDFKIFIKFALRWENVQFMGPFVFATANQWWYNPIGILPTACGYVYEKIATNRLGQRCIIKNNISIQFNYWDTSRRSL